MDLSRYNCMCRDAASDLPHAVLPMMRGFTFLRLTPEMLDPEYQGAWLRFMHSMRTSGAGLNGSQNGCIGQAAGSPSRAHAKGAAHHARRSLDVARVLGQESRLQRASSQ